MSYKDRKFLIKAGYSMMQCYKTLRKATYKIPRTPSECIWTSSVARTLSRWPTFLLNVSALLLINSQSCEKLPETVHISHSDKVKVKPNLFWSVFYNEVLYKEKINGTKPSIMVLLWLLHKQSLFKVRVPILKDFCHFTSKCVTMIRVLNIHC